MQADSLYEPPLVIREKKAGSILSDSKIYTYALNAYTGCQHACSYCYARYMAKYSGHEEPWGHFVDVKINAADLLIKESAKKPEGKVWVSGVCDPYQPLEEKYQLTRQCLEILADRDWPVVIQTRSPLALRDLELFRQFSNIEIGYSIPTGHDRVREIFEPFAPPIPERIHAVKALHDAGLKTYVMIAPLLPRTESLPGSLAGAVDHILVDRMNYHHADHIFKKLKREKYLTKEYFDQAARQIALNCESMGISCRVVF